MSEAIGADGAFNHLIKNEKFNAMVAGAILENWVDKGKNSM